MPLLDNYAVRLRKKHPENEGFLNASFVVFVIITVHFYVENARPATN
jgi:hypothetical protein